MNPTLTFVQITDLHIRLPDEPAYGRIDTGAYLRATIESVLALRQPPEAMLITGDLVDSGRVEEYEYLLELLAPASMPVYVMPGNHDDRNNLRKVFSDHHYLGDGAFLQYRCRIGPLHLIALDTSEPGRVMAPYATVAWRGWSASLPKQAVNRWSWPCITRPFGRSSGIWTKWA